MGCDRVKLTVAKFQDRSLLKDGRCDNDLGLGRPTRGPVKVYSIAFQGKFVLCELCAKELSSDENAEGK